MLLYFLLTTISCCKRSRREKIYRIKRSQNSYSNQFELEFLFIQRVFFVDHHRDCVSRVSSSSPIFHVEHWIHSFSSSDVNWQMFSFTQLCLVDLLQRCLQRWRSSRNRSSHRHWVRINRFSLIYSSVIGSKRTFLLPKNYALAPQLPVNNMLEVSTFSPHCRLIKQIRYACSWSLDDSEACSVGFRGSRDEFSFPSM